MPRASQPAALFKSTGSPSSINPVPAAVAVEPKRERVRRAPTARGFVEPSEQYATAALVPLQGEFSRSRQLVIQRPGRNGFGKPRWRDRALNPAGDFTRLVVGLRL